MAKRNEITNANAPHLEDEIYGAMQREGWTIPTTPETVLLMEKLIAENKLALPPSLDGDPLSILKAPSKPITIPQCGRDEDPGLLENLARAARDAGELLPEIEAQMQRDREHAEKDDAK
jgi:hypothetical protein